MDISRILEFVGAALAGMATAIPLIAKLIQYVQRAIREKNRSRLLGLVLDLMEDAEPLFDTGAKRKEWVMEGVKSMSALVDYELGEQELSDLIDSLCAMSKNVNAPTGSGEDWE